MTSNHDLHYMVDNLPITEELLNVISEKFSSAKNTNTDNKFLRTLEDKLMKRFFTEIVEKGFVECEGRDITRRLSLFIKNINDSKYTKRYA